MFEGTWRDLAYAGRSLAKARAFTFVCVVSLGIGMVPVIAIPYAARISKIPPSGVNTEGLVEVRFAGHRSSSLEGSCLPGFSRERSARRRFLPRS